MPQVRTLRAAVRRAQLLCVKRARLTASLPPQVRSGVALVWLHGYGGAAKIWTRNVQQWAERVAGVQLYKPQAPKMDGGKPAWFDTMTFPAVPAEPRPLAVLRSTLAKVSRAVCM